MVAIPISILCASLGDQRQSVWIRGSIVWFPVRATTLLLLVGDASGICIRGVLDRQVFVGFHRWLRGIGALDRLRKSRHEG